MDKDLVITTRENDLFSFFLLAALRLFSQIGLKIATLKERLRGP